MEVTVLRPQTSKPRSPDSSSSDKRALITEWVVRFALNADKPLNAKEQAVYCSTWEEGFSDLDTGQLKAAFIACLRSHTFKTIPTIGDVRQHLSTAEGNAAEEGAAQKWTQVLEYIRLHWSPDIPPCLDCINGRQCELHKPPRVYRRVSDRTQRAINAAGGLSYIADCDLESRQWARKRFIEAYIRYGELQQSEYLLPDGEVRNVLAGAAQKLLPSPDIYEEGRKKGIKHSEKLKASGCTEPDIQRAMRVIAREVAPSPPSRSLEEQKRFLREKGFLPEQRPAAVQP
jgi:hypothetical protein